MPTGLKFDIPAGYEMQIRPRSGLAAKMGVVAFSGTVDNDYTDEVKVLLFNFGTRPFEIKPGDRIAQLAVREAPAVYVNEVAAILDTGTWWVLINRRITPERGSMQAFILAAAMMFAQAGATQEVTADVLSVKDDGKGGAVFTIKACDKTIQVRLKKEELKNPDLGAYILESAVLKACGIN